jgi:hypothetical protein
MSDKTKFDVKLVNIDNIVITNARIDNDTQLAVLEKHKYIFDITHSFSISINTEQNRMRVVFSCIIKTVSKETNREVDVKANFDIAFFFIVENLKELVSGEFTLTSNADLVVALANISYSTSRGILFTRCQGTIMKSLMLPILENSEIVNMFKRRGPDGINE